MNVILFLLPFVLLSFQEDIPYKPSDEFQINIDLKFKEKPSEYNLNTFSNGGERLDKPKSGMRPFLAVSISQLKVREDEIKILVINSENKELLKKKLPVGNLRFELGFVEDLKSKTKANEISVYFISAEKKKLRKIVFGVLSDGVFQVNGKWRGQF